MTPMNIRKLQIVTMQKNPWLLFKLNYDLDMDYWKRLNCSYDATKDLLNCVSWWIDYYVCKIWVDPILCYRKTVGPMNLQGSGNKIEGDPSEASRDDSREE